MTVLRELVATFFRTLTSYYGNAPNYDLLSVSFSPLTLSSGPFQPFSLRYAKNFASSSARSTPVISGTKKYVNAIPSVPHIATKVDQSWTSCCETNYLL